MHSDIVRDAAGRWPAIFAEFGIDVGNGKHKPCPICGGTDRFRFDDKDGSGSWYCNQCDPHAGFGFDLVMRALEIDFREAAKRVRSMIGGGMPIRPANPKSDIAKQGANRRRLIKLWKASIRITKDCPVGCYLRGRGFDFEPAPDVLRYCSNCYESETRSNLPAMIAVVRDREGDAVTLHRTYLERHAGEWVKAKLKSPRKIMPTIKPMRGAAIRLFYADETVGVAEGVETALACSKRFRIPTWAATSSTILESFEPPAGIKRVFVFGDNDLNHAGQKAAGKLAARLLSIGIDVKIEISPQPGTDWADID